MSPHDTDLLHTKPSRFGTYPIVIIVEWSIILDSYYLNHIYYLCCYFIASNAIKCCVTHTGTNFKHTTLSLLATFHISLFRQVVYIVYHGDFQIRKMIFSVWWIIAGNISKVVIFFCNHQLGFLLDYSNIQFALQR